MDQIHKTYRLNPRNSSGFISKATFLWTCKILKESYNHILEVDDLWEPPKEDKAEELDKKMSKAWADELEMQKKCASYKPSLTKILIRVFGKKYFTIMCIHLTSEIITLSRPYCVVKILLYFTGLLTTEEVTIYVGCLIVLMILYAFIDRHKVTKGLHLGAKIQSALTTLIYKKCLKLNAATLGKTTPGQIMSMVSVNINRFERIINSTPCLFTSPFVILTITAALYSMVGLPALVGLISLIFLIPAQHWICSMMKNYHFKIGNETEKRVELTSEAVRGIETIKMYAWESSFHQLIDQIRRQELKLTGKAMFARGIFYLLVSTPGRIYLYLLLILHVLLGHYVTSNTVFAISLYSYIITHSGVGQTIRGYIDLGELITSIKRIREFLLLEEYSIQVIQSSDKDESVVFKHVLARWPINRLDVTLNFISFSIKQGELIGIFGPVGSGKSSIFQIMLNELPTESGSVVVNGKLSYASQESWIFPASVRQNVIFGQNYDPLRYSAVIKACCLKYDVENFTHNDQTLVGERGVMLSGGQKARVNLARAIYKEADIYLLDDPLSALDAQIGRKIFQNCIKGYLKNKTRIIITHQLQYLNAVDKIIIMNEGKIQFFGTANELYSSNNNYMNLIGGTSDEETEVEQAINDSIMSESEMNINKSEINGYDLLLNNATRNKSISSGKFDPTKEGTQEEIKESGEYMSQKSIFWTYARTGTGVPFIVFVTLLYVCSQFLATGSEFFLSYWITVNQQYIWSLSHETDDSEMSQLSTSNTGDKLSSSVQLNLPYIYVYSGLMMALIVIVLMRMPMFSRMTINTSREIHDQVLQRILHTSLSFFTDNSSGRIMNRLSNDVGDVDSALPISMIDFIQVTIEVVGSLTLTVLTSCLSIIPTVILIIGVYYAQKYYALAFKNLRRVEALARSPVYSYLSSTLQGLSTIHCANVNCVLEEEFRTHLDTNTSVRYIIIQASSGFAWLIDILTTLYFVSILVIIFLFDGVTEIGIGLIITNLLRVISLIQLSLKYYNELTYKITSFERLLQYKSLQPEPDPLIQIPLADDWASEGNIEFRNVTLRYRDDEVPVLKDTMLRISAREKIGIVGRTGAGKSSLINALLRLGLVEGSIKIDGVDTSVVPLSILRSKISIIPQNPTLFSGNVRKNLDPFSTHPDHKLIEALMEVGIYEKLVKNNLLDTAIQEEGSNFSVGEKQLICLARAMVKNNRILIMDEATANMDSKTDCQIQNIIKEKFKHCTILTIAHRLHTVMDSDKILVMDAGKVVEFDSPYKLLCNEETKLSQLVQQTGSITSYYLKNIAKRNYRG